MPFTPSTPRTDSPLVPPQVYHRLIAKVRGLWLVKGAEGAWMHLVDEVNESFCLAHFARVPHLSELLKLLRINGQSQMGARLALVREWKRRPEQVYRLVDRETFVTVYLPHAPEGLDESLLSLNIDNLAMLTGQSPAVLRDELEGRAEMVWLPPVPPGDTAA